MPGDERLMYNRETGTGFFLQGLPQLEKGEEKEGCDEQKEGGEETNKQTTMPVLEISNLSCCTSP